MGRSGLPVSRQAFTEVTVGPESGFHQEETEVGTSGHRDYSFSQDESVVLGSSPGSFSSSFLLSCTFSLPGLFVGHCSPLQCHLSLCPLELCSAVISVAWFPALVWNFGRETQLGTGDQMSSNAL